MSDILLLFGIIATISANVINALLNNKTGDELKMKINEVLINQVEIKSEVKVLKASDELKTKKIDALEKELVDVRKQIREIVA
jgi:hypothetical protein